MSFILISLPFAIAGELKPDLVNIIDKTSATERIPVIILFNERPTPADISAIKSDGASIKYQYKLINAVAVNIPTQAIDKIAKRPFVKLVEPDYKVKLVLDKSISQIQINKVWEAGITGKNIDVAVLDTGIHDEHPDLTVEKEIDYTGEGTDDLHGHGTHVAGTIASTDSTYKGVAYGANLFNVKILNQYGSGSGSDVIKGIEWAVDNGADIISMSLGAVISNCDGSDAISLAVDKAVDSGIIVIVAAGNDGPDSSTITTPGCSKKGITVGAVDDNNNIPSFSSRGPTADGRVKPDLVAPGVGITSTWKDNSFISLSGTSMATPHISGVVALLLETDSSLTSDDIKNILKINSLDLGLDKNIQGAGRVDAYESYIYAFNLIQEPINETEENLTEDAENKTEDSNEEGNNEKGTEKPSKRWDKKLEKRKNPRGIGYGLSRVWEKMNMAFTFNDEKKAELYLKFAERRLSESLGTLDDDNEKTKELLEEYEMNLEKANDISKVAQLAGKNISKITEAISIATLMHLDILEDVLERVPEQAKQSIQRAINSSKKGNKEALNVLEKIKPESAAEIHLKIAERKINKIKSNVEDGKLEDIDKLVKEYKESIEEANRTAKIARNLNKDTSKINQVIDQTVSTNSDILTDVYNRVPKQAKENIERDIDTSNKEKEDRTKSEKEENVLEEILEEAYIPTTIPRTLSTSNSENTRQKNN